MMFWADIKAISQACKYTRGTGAAATIKIPTPKEIVKEYTKLGLSYSHLFYLSVSNNLVATPYGVEVLEYFDYRAKALALVSGQLMDAAQAKVEFDALRATRSSWSCPFPMNKQTGSKAGYNYLTGIVNMLIETHLPAGLSVDYNPTTLTAVTRNQQPLITMSRRVDGAFPRTVNPSAIWEIKEYYHTTSFGSRVSGGVYETLLDGHEINAMQLVDDVRIQHYLIVDAYQTWWDMGKSYLTRMVDMLNAGYVDEVIFGREVLVELPRLISTWPAMHAANVLKHPADIKPA